MKELFEIIDSIKKLQNQPLVIATIVKASGSTYRRPGARMLIAQDGRMTGSISGGCLEGDLYERSKRVLQSEIPELVQYDTTSDDDLVWGLGLGCSGVVHVLLEPLTPQILDSLHLLINNLESDSVAVQAVLFRVQGNLKSKVGSRVLLRDSGIENHGFEDPDLIELLKKDLRESEKSGKPVSKIYKTAEGEAEVFIEVAQPPVSLVIFGAGHDAIPVTRFAKELGWTVTIVDSRPAFVTSERFPGADSLVVSEAENIGQKLRLTGRTAAVVMTHNYAHDVNLLRTLLRAKLAYLGVLGPKKRTQKILDELEKEGIAPLSDRLFSPVGVDIGAETPEEIALSILSEIQAVLAGRNAGLLRNRKGSIHDRPD